LIVEPGLKVSKIVANARHTDAWGDILNLAFVGDDGRKICSVQPNDSQEGLTERALGPDDTIVGFYAGTTQGFHNNIAALGFIVKRP